MSACPRGGDMQAETQNQPAAAPENTVLAESVESKSKRGGKRPGAGRKSNPTKLLRGVSRETLAAGVANIDIAAVLAGLLRSKREIIRLQTLNFVYDRMLGKPKQDVSVSGGLLHAHTAYRDPKLAALSPEELANLDALTRKLALPAPVTPQNQIESKPAIEDAKLDCGSIGH